jgi:hypothetical protein
MSCSPFVCVLLYILLIYGSELARIPVAVGSILISRSEEKI